jgi:uncharacterized protein with FMN-binding domain
MPRRGAIAVILTTFALILLLSFKTPDTPTPLRLAVGPGATSTPARPGDLTGAPASVAPGDSAATAGTITGPVVETRYGPVQLQAKFDAGKITDVQALQLPTDRRLSAQISQYVAPILRSEALQAQSPQIDIVSGATYTSDGYAQSIQAILDQVHG